MNQDKIYMENDCLCFTYNVVNIFFREKYPVVRVPLTEKNKGKYFIVAFYKIIKIGHFKEYILWLLCLILITYVFLSFVFIIMVLLCDKMRGAVFAKHTKLLFFNFCVCKKILVCI